MPLTKRQLTTPSVRHLLAAATIGLLLGFTGPFGTYPRLDRPLRYAFWFGLTLFGYACVLAARSIVRATPWAARLPAAARLALVALISSIPQTLAVAWALPLSQPGRAIPSPAQLPLLFVAVLAVQLVIAFVAAEVVTREEPASEPQPAAPRPSFVDRLPPHLDRDVIALEAQDHYLKVHTASGSALVLTRLADAIAQLHGTDGLQVHRGWWIAAGAVVGVEGDGGRTIVRMRNGLGVPVSRTYLQAVRGRTWASTRANT